MYQISFKLEYYFQANKYHYSRCSNKIKGIYKRNIDNSDGLNIVAEASTGSTLIKKCRKLNPDLLIVFLYLQDLNFGAIVAEVNKEFPKIKIIAISRLYSKAEFVELVKGGVTGYLERKTFIENLPAIQNVLKNRIYYCEQIIQLIFPIISEGRFDYS